MKNLELSQMESIVGGDLDGAVAVACGIIAVADAAWYFGLINPTFGVALVVGSLACAGYGLATA